MVEEQIQQLQSAALARIEAAQDRDALEQVRVDVLGRKGLLGQFNVGKLPPEEKAKAGKALNAAKQVLTSAFETKDQTFAAQALTLPDRCSGFPTTIAPTSCLRMSRSRLRRSSPRLLRHSVNNGCAV